MDTNTAATDAILILSSGGSSGTAFVIGPNIAVTAAHVVEGRDYISVMSVDGPSTPLAARVVSRNEGADLALLHVPSATGLEPIAFSEEVSKGQSVVAIGVPDNQLTITYGKVMSIEEKTLKASAQVAPGNSGGPLLNNAGEAIGVVTQLELATGLAVAQRPGEVFEMLAALPPLNDERASSAGGVEFSLIIAITLLVLLIVAAGTAGLGSRKQHRERERNKIRITMEGM